MKMVLLVCLLGMSATPALATEKNQKRNYAKVNLGVYQPTNQLDDDNYDTGVNLTLSYGRYLTRNLCYEVGLDDIGSANDLSGSNGTAGTYDQDNVIYGNGLIFTVKGVYPKESVRLYAGGGIGLYAVTLAAEIDSSSLGNFDKVESDFIVGGHAVAGLDLDITDRFFINFEGKYRITDDADINKKVASIPVAYKGDLNGYSVTTGIGYRF